MLRNNIIQGPNSDNSSLASDIDAPGKYKSTISNILSKHCAEIKIASDEVVHSLTSISNKKLKDLISHHNNELFGFMTRPGDIQPYSIGLAETIFRKYGHDIPSIKGDKSGAIFRDLNLDISMCNVTTQFDEGLKKNTDVGCNGLDAFLKQTRWIFNQYRTIGEEIIRLETTLFQKIDLLDKLNSRVQIITSLTNNEVLPELIESFTKYTDSIYKSTKIEDNYKQLVEAYKQWNICRQIISLRDDFRTNDPQCAICLTEPISNVIVPCGHTFCENCIKKQNISCYICRSTIRERVKLFFT